MKNRSSHLENVLQEYGFRKTGGRTELLSLLAAQQKPVTADFLESKLSHVLDRGTLYRALDAFTAAGILGRYDFGHGHAHYELAVTKPHHHHAVCEGCGVIEDIPAPHEQTLSSHALKHSRSFKSFTRHSLEFYGLCASCAP
jgi:Fur family transcriptional regulator, ferric uptake regulator